MRNQTLAVFLTGLILFSSQGLKAQINPHDNSMYEDQIWMSLITSQNTITEELIEAVDASYTRWKRSSRNHRAALNDRFFQYYHWRYGVRNILVNNLKRAMRDNSKTRFFRNLELLKSLRAMLKLDDTFEMIEWYNDHLMQFSNNQNEKFIRFLGTQNNAAILKEETEDIEERLPYAAKMQLKYIWGPGVEVDFGPNGYEADSRRWEMDDWTDEEEYRDSYYSKIPYGVRYRGIDFKNGDVLVTRGLGKFLFTTFDYPKGPFGHAAMFMMMEKDGNYYPSVIEVSTYGVRAVPLEVFLNQNFIAVIEVYRHNQLSNDRAIYEFTQQARPLIVEKLPNNVSYNLQLSPTEETGRSRHVFTCADFVAFIFEEMGLNPIEIKTEIMPTVFKHSKYFGFSRSDYLSPSDYAADTDLYYVGTIDNQKMEAMLTQAVISDQFKKRFEEADKLDLPWTHGLYSTMARVLQSEVNPLGSIIRFFVGFNTENVPTGAGEALSFISHMMDAGDEGYDNCIEQAEEHAQSIRRDGMFWLDIFLQTEGVQEAGRECLEDVDDWFLTNEQIEREREERIRRLRARRRRVS